MKLSLNDIAKPALLTGQMILSGWAGAAAADEPGAAARHAFPAESEGYSRATDTAVTMTCRPDGTDTVCTIDASGNLPMLHIQQEITVTPNGLSATGDANLGWSTQKFKYDFSPIKDRAEGAANTGVYTKLADGKGVEVCDAVPVTTEAGVGLCVRFSAADGVVQMKVGLTGSLGEAFGPYQGRSFDFAGGGDESHMNRLLGKTTPTP